MRKARKKYLEKIVVLLASALLLSSCVEIPKKSRGLSINSVEEQEVPNSSDSQDKRDGNTESSPPRPYIKLQVKNELPFNQEIYQLLDSLGGELGDNQGDLTLVLKMQVTAKQTLRVKEDITGELDAVEKALWKQLKSAVSELLRECRQVPVGVEIEYSKSR